jgi:predicted MFS family arabinose efflux permease
MSLPRQRNFTLFWTGESVSEFGNSITIVVVPLVAINTLHTSTFTVTLLNAFVWLPWLIIGVPAGAWVDRLPPRAVMLTCDAVSLAVYLSVPVAAWLGVLTVAQLIAVTLIAGAATVFFRSAYQVLLPGIVAEPDLTEANAKLMGSREVAQIAGPGLGGLIAQIAGPVIGLLADAISFGVSFICLSATGRPRESRERAEAAPRASFMTEAAQGLHFLWRDPYLRFMAVFGALANLALTGTDALIVVFLVRVNGLSSGVAGLVLALAGVGGLLGAVIAQPLARRFGSARAVVLADIIGLPPVLLLPLTHAGPRLTFAIVAYVFLAGGVTTANVIGASWRQSYVPPDMLGRVSSVTMTVAYAMMPIGSVLGGVLATALGVRNALWIITAVISACALLYLVSPIRRLRDMPPRPEPVTIPEPATRSDV